MRQELLLENVLGVLDPFVPGDTRLSSPHSNKVLGHLLLLDDEGLVQGRFQLREGSERAGGREWEEEKGEDGE